MQKTQRVDTEPQCLSMKSVEPEEEKDFLDVEVISFLLCSRF